MKAADRLARWDAEVLPVLAAQLPAGRSWRWRRVGSRRLTGLVAGLVVAAAGTLVALLATSRPAAPIAPAGLSCGLPASVQGTAYVGPRPGITVSGYDLSRRRLLQTCAALEPGARTLAVISLRSGQTPTAAATALSGMPIVRVYLDVPGHRSRYVDVAGHGLTGGQGVSLAVVRLAAGLQRQDPAEANALRAGCPCVYAAAGTASFQAFLALSARATVRLVDLAPVGARLAAATLRPLTPVETSVVSDLPMPLAGSASR